MYNILCEFETTWDFFSCKDLNQIGWIRKRNAKNQILRQVIGFCSAKVLPISVLLYFSCKVLENVMKMTDLVIFNLGK